MPPIVLWPSLAVTAGFGLFFTASAALGVLQRVQAARGSGSPAQPLFALVLSAALAAFSWFCVYRIFHPS